MLGGRLGTLLILAAALASPVAAAPAFVPYGNDPQTLHLWHLDEAGPPFKDDGTSPTPLLGLLNGAQAGQAPFPGFGAAVTFEDPGKESLLNSNYGPILLAKPALAMGPQDNVDPPFPIAGPDGAFTFEALVKLDCMPQDSSSQALDIVSMDDEDSTKRTFIFRIEKPGFLCFVPITGAAVRGGGLATIPVTGPHAMVPGEWFHAAVAYDGRETAVNNLKLYWTRLSAGNEVANLIGQGTLTADLGHGLGDFAIGNSGQSNGVGPNEFFPGAIDEVRISGIARQPYDFCFVSEDAKYRAVELSRRQPPKIPQLGMSLDHVAVDDERIPLPPEGKPLVLGWGLHRLDFDFGLVNADPLVVRSRLEGLDDEWHPSARGMTMEWQMIDGVGKTLARRLFSVTGASIGWELDAVSSPLVRRSEPLFIPEATRRLQVTVSSGENDTTGTWVIDDLSLTSSRTPGVNLWPNGNFRSGERTNQIGGIPEGWTRAGTEKAIARVMQLPNGPALGLLDAAQERSASWISQQDLKEPPAKGGETYLLSWSEAYNVIPGASLRATYINVPAGHYTFRAIAVGNDPSGDTTHLAFPLVVEEPFWRQGWFIPAVVAGGVLMVGLVSFVAYRRRSRHRLAAIKLQHAVERDRARIARDMHDDLGTRVTVLNLAASFLRRSIGGDPDKARQQIVRLESAARDLVNAMDGLVWAVNPANDTLDHLATHLSAVAQEIFRDSPAKLRISIPPDLPALPLRSDFRHHFALGVKEALHNTLKHAGACDVLFKLSVSNGDLIAVIEDNGAGFDLEAQREGNGLLNLAARFEELAGTFRIDSEPGKGTRAVFSCHLPQIPALPHP
ncbi:histidine kinase [Haloferula sp. BvORR071]|uniref:histidine kinase n=1 Tax=Haloferula sp. BvORR071 TaxID=1396141 RepID=UPI000558B601|nr:histidine kinase [Haloferula sp. BvORR071]